MFIRNSRVRIIIPRVKNQARGQKDRPRALNEVLYFFVALILLEVHQSM